jgi:hypothetical protein
VALDAHLELTEHPELHRHRAPPRTAIRGGLAALLATLTLAALGLTAAPASAAPMPRPDIPAGYTSLTPGNFSEFVSHGPTIESVANGLFVSAELLDPDNSYGQLRARASAASAWEGFTIAAAATDANGVTIWTIQSQANGLYVSAELLDQGDDYGRLRARSFTAGFWESFYIDCSTTGTCAITSVANQKRVRAETGFTGNRYGLLRAVDDPAVVLQEDLFVL